MSYNAKSILRKQIVNYLLENPIERGTPGCYEKVGNLFDVKSEYVRSIYRSLRENGQVENDDINGDVKREFKENVKRGEADLSVVTSKRVKTLDDLVEICEIDLNEWEIVSWECNKWEVGRKDKTIEWKIKKGQVKAGKVNDTGRIFVEPLFQVKAKLSRRKVDTDLIKQKEALLKELRSYAPKIAPLVLEESENRTCLLELCMFDLHLGSLSWREESGDDYDLKIGEKRFKDSVKELLTRVNLKSVDKILFPVGNDFLNIDNKNNTTVNGTVVDTDCRFMKMIKVARRIIVETIDQLSTIAPIDVLIVPGNHDATSTFMLGEILDAFYHNNERVMINNQPTSRKYYQYGLNGFLLTHGDEEPHAVLGHLFASEQPKLWADTKYRFTQLGHFHKSKKITYLTTDEYPGFQVQILPTLSSLSAWAYKKGYGSLKQAKAFLYDKKKGCIGEFTSTAL